MTCSNILTLSHTWDYTLGEFKYVWIFSIPRDIILWLVQASTSTSTVEMSKYYNETISFRKQI